MNFFTILSIFAPLVASVAVDLSGSGSAVCRPECEQSYNLCMSQFYRDPKKVPQCLEFVCAKYENNCPDCGYCGTLHVDARNEIPADTVKEVSTPNEDKDAHTNGWRCYAYTTQCSPDGKTIQVCHMTNHGWDWVYKSACGHQGCCRLGNGQDPHCTC